jgi:protein-disulfide isomerase
MLGELKETGTDVGGAERRERERRQAATEARLQAARKATGKASRGGILGNTPALAIVAVVVVAAIIVGVVIAVNRNSAANAPVAANYPVSRADTVIVAGQPSAPKTVSVYEDYLCPYCERLEQRYGDQMTTALNAGQIKVEYHALGFLDASSSPAGYSTRAANAALCAADANIWPAYHAALYAAQPAEGGPGLSDEELIQKGTDLGAPNTFGQCVTGNGNAAAIASATNTAVANPALQSNGRFGTPTVIVNGSKVDLNDTNWLTEAIAG